jgi:hypothetical protein
MGIGLARGLVAIGRTRAWSNVGEGVAWEMRRAPGALPLAQVVPLGWKDRTGRG